MIFRFRSVFFGLLAGSHLEMSLEWICIPIFLFPSALPVLPLSSEVFFSFLLPLPNDSLAARGRDQKITRFVFSFRFRIVGERQRKSDRRERKPTMKRWPVETDFPLGRRSSPRSSFPLPWPTKNWLTKSKAGENNFRTPSVSVQSSRWKSIRDRLQCKVLSESAIVWYLLSGKPVHLDERGIQGWKKKNRPTI